MEKTLKAVFQDGKDTVRVRGLWQYDTGVQLEVEGIPAGDVNRVDFGMDFGSETIPVLVTQTASGTFTARIPAKVTEFPGAVTAYIYLATADSGYTIKKVVMPMMDRPEPGTGVPEESTNPFGEAIEKEALDNNKKRRRAKWKALHEKNIMSL